MKVAELQPAMDARVSFDPRFSIRIPSAPGCYILSTIYDDVLYIGETNDLGRRMGEHLDDPRMTRRTPEGLASWFHYKELPDDKTYPTEQFMLSQHCCKVGRKPALNRR